MRSEYGPDIFESRAQASAAREAQIERSRVIADEIGLTPQEISEIEAGADEISLFGKIRDRFGGLIANAKQSVVVRTVAVGVVLAAAASACENPIQSDPRDDPEKTPTVLTPESRETGTPLVIPTVTKTPVETETPAPTDTVEPTRTPTNEPTEKPTPKPTPSETPNPTDTPTVEPTTETPTVEPTPEIDPLNREFVQEMYDVLLNQIDWGPFGVGKNFIQGVIKDPEFGLEHWVETNQPTEVLKKLLELADTTKQNPDWGSDNSVKNNPVNPEDFIETDAHKLLREKAIEPLTSNIIETYSGKPDSQDKILSILLDNSAEWKPDRWTYKPFSQFVDVISSAPGLNSLEKRAILRDFKMYLITGNIIKLIANESDVWCGQNNGSERDLYMKDSYVIPFADLVSKGISDLTPSQKENIIPHFNLLPEMQDFSDITKLQAKIYLRSCGVG